MSPLQHLDNTKKTGTLIHRKPTSFLRPESRRLSQPPHGSSLHLAREPPSGLNRVPQARGFALRKVPRATERPGFPTRPKESCPERPTRRQTPSLVAKVAGAFQPLVTGRWISISPKPRLLFPELPRQRAKSNKGQEVSERERACARPGTRVRRVAARQMTTRGP